MFKRLAFLSTLILASCSGTPAPAEERIEVPVVSALECMTQGNWDHRRIMLLIVPLTKIRVHREDLNESATVEIMSDANGNFYVVEHSKPGYVCLLTKGVPII